jgi:hypothetical protein
MKREFPHDQPQYCNSDFNITANYHQLTLLNSRDLLSAILRPISKGYIDVYATMFPPSAGYNLDIEAISGIMGSISIGEC